MLMASGCEVFRTGRNDANKKDWQRWEFSVDDGVRGREVQHNRDRNDMSRGETTNVKMESEIDCKNQWTQGDEWNFPHK